VKSVVQKRAEGEDGSHEHVVTYQAYNSRELLFFVNPFLFDCD
jgi:hypothetical protein